MSIIKTKVITRDGVKIELSFVTNSSGSEEIGVNVTDEQGRKIVFEEKQASFPLMTVSGAFC